MIGLIMQNPGLACCWGTSLGSAVAALGGDKLLDEVCAEKGAGFISGYFLLFVKISCSFSPDVAYWSCELCKCITSVSSLTKGGIYELPLLNRRVSIVG